jgi:hypothetical protein
MFTYYAKEKPCDPKSDKDRRNSLFYFIWFYFIYVKVLNVADLMPPDTACGSVVCALFITIANSVPKGPSCTVGRDSVAGIAIRCGLDGPGIESRWGRDFPHPSRPALGPIQRPVHWVPGLSPGVKRPGRVASHPTPF